MRVARIVAVVMLTMVAALAQPALAADPGRWRETSRLTLPLDYFQGMASNGPRNLYFAGVFEGVYRTDAALTERVRVPSAIPAAVKEGEGYNHIGDIAFDHRRGRLLAPLECFYPGQPEPNTCHTGAIAVIDPVTLAWDYHVILDPAEISKAMWVAVNPAGDLVWTQSGQDLVAFRTGDIDPSHSPGGPPMRVMTRLRGVVPERGIAGAAFYGNRLYAATHHEGVIQIFSYDLQAGSRRLEIELRANAEVEGIDFVEALGGELHWLLSPLVSGTPTFARDRVTMLSFRPRADLRRAILLSASPVRPAAGGRTRFRFRAVTGRGRPVAGATVRFAGRRTRTNRRGRASISAAVAGTERAFATRRGMLAGAAEVRPRE